MKLNLKQIGLAATAASQAAKYLKSQGDKREREAAASGQPVHGPSVMQQGLPSIPPTQAAMHAVPVAQNANFTETVPHRRGRRGQHRGGGGGNRNHNQQQTA